MTTKVMFMIAIAALIAGIICITFTNSCWYKLDQIWRKVLENFSICIMILGFFSAIMIPISFFTVKEDEYAVVKNLLDDTQKIVNIPGTYFNFFSQVYFFSKSPNELCTEVKNFIGVPVEKRCISGQLLSPDIISEISGLDNYSYLNHHGDGNTLIILDHFARSGESHPSVVVKPSTVMLKKF